MKKCYFNTGIKFQSGCSLYGDQEWINGTKQIPFYVDVLPEHAQFVFACDNPDLLEAHMDCFVVREMYNTSMVSKYAYFRI